MIIPDVNLLVYAYNSSAIHHKAARKWLEDALSGRETVGFPWAVIMGYIRLLSNPHIVQSPDRPEELIQTVKTWLELPSTRLVTPGHRHLEIAEKLYKTTGGTWKLTTDIHIAAVAIELDAAVYSNDIDFGRFRDLSWINPLE